MGAYGAWPLPRNLLDDTNCKYNSAKVQYKILGARPNVISDYLSDIHYKINLVNKNIYENP